MTAKVLVSRCLLGEPVRYDGQASGYWALLMAWQAEGRVVPLCPEVAGGLPTPRPPAEIDGGQGRAVLAGQARIIASTGEDVTASFLAGAEAALALVRAHDIRVAVLKANSPSCGNEQTYDGSFSGRRVTGEGVTAALLAQAGVKVFNEGQLEQVEALLERLEP
ncbi:2-thiouracil desulfurase family protein [Pseudomonas massiliensis]|uniref:DUF523 domain-containing protein n=1 Tax=Pseudomonas massiliensis TaxID=522492 RepID=UPI00058C00DF|nr:DUF523 domain-containing protein [Pseudomonas massiliensis]